ncbi:MAG: hypothetical protein FGM53_03985 [Rhodocyclaceae bacterium]|nr:hypothetical protein [Rhodocyclaceae bacterium]
MISRCTPSRHLLAIGILLSLSLTACSSGPFKWNQSGQSAAVQENPDLPKPKAVAYTVLIAPSGAIRTQYISDRTATAAGVVGSMVVGPIAGAIGGLVGSTASSTAASSAEEKASRNIDSSDIAQAVAPIQLQAFLASALADKLNVCGIRAEVHPTLLNPNKPDWSTTHLVVPPEFMRDAEPHRFFVETGVLGLQVRAALTDTTMEGNAYARVYETRSLKQIGRYSKKTGSSGSITLNNYGAGTPQETAELQRSARLVAQHLASGIATDMCAIMRRF